MWLQIQNLTHPLPTPLRVRDCRSFGCRLRGLMFRRRLATDEGLWLRGSRLSRLESAIHMLFVFFDLGVLWLDDRGVVVDRRLARRWRPLYISRRPARDVLEIAPARLEEFQIGDALRLLPLD